MKKVKEDREDEKVEENDIIQYNKSLASLKKVDKGKLNDNTYQSFMLS